MKNQKIDKNKILNDLEKEPRFNKMVLFFIALCTICILFFCIYSSKVTWNTILFISFILLCVFGFFLFFVIPDELQRWYIKKQITKNNFYVEKRQVENVEKIQTNQAIIYRTYFCKHKHFFDFDYKINEKDVYLLVFLRKRKKRRPYLLMAYPYKTS